jgi:hypothetical protein
LGRKSTLYGPITIVAAARKRSPLADGPASPKQKADVAEHPKAFDHVGLLTNEPPGTAELLFI